MSSDHARPRTPTKEENGIRNQERPINSQRDNRDKEYREKDLRDKNPPSNYRRESKDLKDYREYRGDRDRDFRDRDREYRSRRENERSPRERDFRDGKDMRAHRDNAPRNPPNYQKNPQTTQTTQPPPPIHPPPPPPAEEEKMEGFNPNAPRKARWGSRSVDIFQKLEQIGEGTYGKVYMAKNKHTGETVALKKVRMANEKEGFPITAIREIKILKELHHENVVQLKEIVTSKATSKGKAGIYMVFEYMDHDLTGLMLNEGRQWRPSQAQIKCYMKQLLEGLHYCHSNNVLHRDIKGSNLLLDNNGRLKLADFGLARPYTDQQSNSYTNRVITLWYRPPELLLGAVQYGPAIDMWSVGCILTELLIGKAIFPGRSEIDQLESIFKVCGTPTHENWPDVDKLSWWHMFKPQKDIKRNLKETITKIAGYAIPKEALDLIDKLLTLDPKKRISAADALDNDYFWTPPAPAKASELPKFPSCHEYQAKKRRMQNSQPQAEPRMDRDIKRQKGPTGAPVSQYQSHPQQPQPFHSQQQQFHPQQKSNNGAVPTNAPQQQPRQPNNPNRYSLNQQPQPQQQRSKPYGMNMNRV